ncbi:hypothetical protein GCM10010954_29870 [Halobacillus andaensis]|uniref:Uncharacterized protein n=1 Tax=Halobacillus andaensis TaxID=1176239 RepID=A0A917B7Y5_HALAA|nr:hypothetical protein [Halobacillus andaensis]MBP2005090.1 hypothetical protein [Halobacillus andaensis]GGF28810.1 hypothetical protein GCM10010954_29870 [Halobacillus andaensis]
MNRDPLELVKVVSLAIIAVSMAVIAWRLGKVADYLYDLVMLSGNG